MVKTFVASTRELDEIDVAVKEIMTQLKPETNFLRNSIAIVSCHFEFVIAGVVKAIYDALPCDMVGTVSVPLATAEEYDMVMFSIMIITSDESDFVASLTLPVLEDSSRTIAETYAKTASKKLEKPSLILAYAPFIAQNSGDEYMRVISEVSDNIPCFGTLATDGTTGFANAYMIYNGEYYQDRFAMILAYDLNPKFYIANFSYEKAMGNVANVTKSEGHVIMEINGRSVDEFFTGLGLTKASETEFGMIMLPFAVDYNDGTPKVARVFVTLTPERYALYAGEIPEGSAIQITSNEKSDILETTKNTLDELAKDMQNASGLLIYSCVSRYMALGADIFKEIELVTENVKVPYLMAYAGGEICPTQVIEKTAANRFHNNTFTACLF